MQKQKTCGWLGKLFKILLAGLVLFVAVAVIDLQMSYKEITWSTFCTEHLASGKVDHLKVEIRGYVKVIPKDGNLKTIYYFNIGSVDSFERALLEAHQHFNIDWPNRVSVKYAPYFLNAPVGELFLVLPLMFFLLAALMVAFPSLRKMVSPFNIFGFAESRAKVINKGDSTVLFKDVAGCEEAKLEIIEFVNFLKNPAQYKALGARIPKGALLSGSPGTGKTMLAKAAAGEANCSFISATGSEFVQMFVGVGAARVRDMFQKARDKAPCILFIDELDAIGRARGYQSHSNANTEQEGTLNQILTEMDGFSSEDSNVIVLAATNRVDILDKALLRPGRFDRKIQLTLPDIKGRASIFRVHLAPLKCDLDKMELSKKLAAKTPGFSGAEIANMCNEAALIAARDANSVISMLNFEQAVDRIIGGMEKRGRILKPNEKKITAYHEAGHAVAGWFLEHCDPLVKVSLIPRGQSLGFAQYQPSEKYLYSKLELQHQIRRLLAGHLAEELFFGGTTTGAKDDFEKVTKIAYSMVVEHGMSNKFGKLSFDVNNDDSPTYSSATEKLVDEEVREIVQIAEFDTQKLLKTKKEEIEKVAKRLLEKEVLTKEDMVELLGPRAYQQDETYEELTDETSHSQEDATLLNGLKT